MTFERLKKIMEHENCKTNIQKLELLIFNLGKMESKRDVYKYLDYIGFKEDYEKFLKKYNFVVYEPTRMELIAEELYFLDKRFECVEVGEIFGDKKTLTMINVNSTGGHVDTVEIRYNKNDVSVMAPYYGKYLGDLYEGRITLDKTLSYSGNVTEKIKNYILEKYFKQ